MNINKYIQEAEQEINHQADRWAGGSLDQLAQSDLKNNGPMEWIGYISHYMTSWFPGGYPPYDNLTLKAFRKSMVKVLALSISALNWADSKLSEKNSKTSFSNKLKIEKKFKSYTYMIPAEMVEQWDYQVDKLNLAEKSTPSISRMAYENLEYEFLQNWRSSLIPKVDRNAVTTTNGKPLDQKSDDVGQHGNYLVLTEEERLKGFIRPIRDAYKHIGRKIEGTFRYLTLDELECHKKYGFVAYVAFPESHRPAVGQYLTQREVDTRNGDYYGGCGNVTTMGRSLAETYARDPGFYGSTYCSICKSHFPVGKNGEFVWYPNDDLIHEHGDPVGT